MSSTPPMHVAHEAAGHLRWRTTTDLRRRGGRGRSGAGALPWGVPVAFDLDAEADETWQGRGDGIEVVSRHNTIAILLVRFRSWSRCRTSAEFRRCRWSASSSRRRCRGAASAHGRANAAAAAGPPDRLRICRDASSPIPEAKQESSPLQKKKNYRQLTGPRQKSYRRSRRPGRGAVSTSSTVIVVFQSIVSEGIMTSSCRSCRRCLSDDRIRRWGQMKLLLSRSAACLAAPFRTDDFEERALLPNRQVHRAFREALTVGEGRDAP